MPHCAIPCANKVDIGVVFVCYIPMSAIVYACCYLMLNNMHPNHEHEHETFVLYGCTQCCIGFVTWYCTARWIYYKHWRSRPKPTATTEEVPLLVTPPQPSADTEEAEAP
jgi:hypothetical protein